MKQHITEDQWNELAAQEKFDIWNKFFPDNEDGEVIYIGKIKAINIMVMIEFLGDGLTDFVRGNSNGKVAYILKYKEKQITSFELCDALWEACKYKLNKLQ